MEREWLVNGLAAGALAAMLTVAAAATETFRALEARTGDLRLRAEAALAGAAPDSSIVLVDIDNRSLREAAPVFGRWPWPRDAHAAIVDFVAIGRPRAVGYDILFVEPDLERPQADSVLAAATARAGVPVVHSTVLVRRRERASETDPAMAGVALPFPPPPEAPRYADALQPYSALLSTAAGVGVIDRFPDPDGVERREPLLFGMGDRAYPSLGLAMAAGGRAGYPRLSVSGSDLRLDGRRLPLERGRLRLHWRGGYGARPYPVIPAHAILRGYHDIATGNDPELDPAVFHDRYVLVGSSATGVGDLLASPFGPSEPGVLLHATLLDTILREGFLRAPPPWLAAAATAGVALLAGLLAAGAGTVGGAAARSLGLLVAWTAVAVGAFAVGGWLLPLAGPAFGALLAYAGASAGSWLTEGRRHREIKRAFGKFVPSDVVETIARDRRLLRRVDRREITVLFADVRGFTTLSEYRGPEEVVETLNELFSELVETLFRHGGTLDKFLGDGLMAVFGAPLVLPDHAARACRAALDMQERLADLNRRFAAAGRPVLAMGVGVHSGEAVVGFVGDVERRLDYTAIGDTVNIASRLQDQTKELGVAVVVSAETMRRAGAGFTARPLGEVHVRGRTEPIGVYALETAPSPR